MCTLLPFLLFLALYVGCPSSMQMQIMSISHPPNSQHAHTFQLFNLTSSGHTFLKLPHLGLVLLCLCHLTAAFLRDLLVFLARHRAS